MNNSNESFKCTHPIPQGSVVHQFIENQLDSSKRYPSRIFLNSTEDENNNDDTGKVTISPKLSPNTSSRTVALSHLNSLPISVEPLDFKKVLTKTTMPSVENNLKECKNKMEKSLSQTNNNEENQPPLLVPKYSQIQVGGHQNPFKMTVVPILSVKKEKIEKNEKICSCTSPAVTNKTCMKCNKLKQLLKESEKTIHYLDNHCDFYKRELNSTKKMEESLEHIFKSKKYPVATSGSDTCIGNNTISLEDKKSLLKVQKWIYLSRNTKTFDGKKDQMVETDSNSSSENVPMFEIGTNTDYQSPHYEYKADTEDKMKGRIEALQVTVAARDALLHELQRKLYKGNKVFRQRYLKIADINRQEKSGQSIAIEKVASSYLKFLFWIQSFLDQSWNEINAFDKATCISDGGRSLFHHCAMSVNGMLYSGVFIPISRVESESCDKMQSKENIDELKKLGSNKSVMTNTKKSISLLDTEVQTDAILDHREASTSSIGSTDSSVFKLKSAKKLEDSVKSSKISLVPMKQSSYGLKNPVVQHAKSEETKTETPKQPKTTKTSKKSRIPISVKKLLHTTKSNKS